MDIFAGLSKTGSMALEVTKAVGEKAGNAVAYAAQGMENVYNTTVEDKKKLEKIKSIEQYCKKIKNWVETEQEKYETALNEEVRFYSLQCKAVAEKEKVVQQYILFCNENSAGMKFTGKRQELSVKNNVSVDTIEVAGNSIAGGVIAGAAVGGGAAGLMAAFGAASTGTALSALKGAAFTKALLAAFGGGSIATGGFGIVGGTVVLGSLVAIPALAVGGLIADKKINETYAEAKKCETEAKEAETTCKKIFATYDAAISYLHTINVDFENFRKTFSKIVDITLVAANDDSIRDKYDALLKKSVNIANRFMSVKLLDKNNKIVDGIETAIQELKEGTEECDSEYSALDSIIPEPVQEFVAQMVPSTSENWNTNREELEKLKKENAQLREKNAEQQKENAQLKEQNAEKEKENTQLKIENANQKQTIVFFEELQKEWLQEKERMRSEKEESEAEITFLKKVNEDLRNSMPKEYDTYYETMRTKFPHVEKYDTNIIKFLATGELIYEAYHAHKFDDCSTSILEFGKAIETLFIGILITKKLLDLEPDEKVPEFYKLIMEYVDHSSIGWQDKFSDDLHRARKIRNAAAHYEVTNESEMEEIRSIAIVGKKQPPKRKGVIAYMDGLLKK